jgi:DNA repair exonuclease SbcCD nuclease subunit
MKIAIIADTHYGVRGDSTVFLDHQKLFMDTVFFPTISDQDVDWICHLGDLVDRRKVLNINTSRRLRHDFLDRLNRISKDMRYPTTILAGNHDTFFKDTNRVNALDEVLHGYEFIESEIEPGLHPSGIQLIPWICQDNAEDSLQQLKTSTSKICLGHLEIKGFEMYKGSVCDHGLDSSIFNRFDFVGSGHFHHKSRRGNISYLGAPFQMVWSDFDDDRGFHILDTETLQLTFYPNPFEMFHKITYDEKPPEISEGLYAGKYVKVVVKNRGNAYLFDEFIAKLERIGPQDLQILDLGIDMIEQTQMLPSPEDGETTLAILEKHVTTLDFQGNKGKLQALMRDLYNDALRSEV